MHRIAIHGAPRSGTTWLANIFNSSEHVIYRQQPLFSYAFKAFLDGSSDPSRIAEFFDGIYASDDAYLNQIAEIANGKVPNFRKSFITHLVYKEVRYHYVLDNLLSRSDAHLVGIIRNPCAVLNSFFKAPAEFKQEWKVEDEWLNATKKNEGRRENYFGYRKWKEVATLFHELQEKYGKSRVTIIDYSQLVTDTYNVVSDLFGSLGLEVSDQTLAFIGRSKNINDSDPYSVFRKKVDDDQWKETFDGNILNYVQVDLEGSVLMKYMEE